LLLQQGQPLHQLLNILLLLVAVAGGRLTLAVAGVLVGIKRLLVMPLLLEVQYQLRWVREVQHNQLLVPKEMMDRLLFLAL
jgi:hypothetical protein